MKRIILLSLVSFAFFFAGGQALQLEHPAKGDVWPAFTKQRIEWQTANVDNIKIEISTDSARTWAVLQTSYPASAGSYEWTVLNKPSDSCFVRITDVATPSVSSSNYPGNPFKIPKPVIKIDDIAAEVYGNTAVPISWESSGVQVVRILASYNNGLSFTQVANNIPASNGFCNWVAKDTNATNCLIVIQSGNNPFTTDTIDQRFTIKRLPNSTPAKFKGGSYDGHSSGTNTAKAILLVTPNSREELTANTSFLISWRSSSINRVNLKFSVDSGMSWINIADSISAAVLSYSWNVPSTPSKSCFVKIEDADNTSFFDISDVSFSIKSNTIQLISPLAGEIGIKGQVLPISWTSTGLSKVKISYNDGTTWKTIKETDANAEVINWIIPNNMSTSVQLKVSDFSNEQQFDAVSGINIKAAPEVSANKYRGGSFDGHSSGTNMMPYLTLTTPNSNIQIPSAIQYNITWTSLGIDKVNISFSPDNGKNWTTVINSYANTGSYLWTVPGIASTECLIKIQSTDLPNISDSSDAVFTILPKLIQVVIDTVSTKYYNTVMPIGWIHTGVEKVNITSRISAGETWSVIKSSVPANFEQINWTVPAIPTDSIWIRVSDFENENMYDEQLLTGFQQLPFISTTKYKGGSFDGHTFRSTNNKISIKKPAANDTLVSGTKFTITWNAGNVTDSVKLQYSTDSSRTWRTITNASAIEGQYSWTVPSELSNRVIAGKNNRTNDLISDRCLVRAVDLQNGSEVIGLTEKTFTIVQPAILPVTIISFKGKFVGEKVELNWKTENEQNVKQYEVERSFDGVIFKQVGEVKAGSSGVYTYIDNEAGKEVKLFYRLKKVDKDDSFNYSSVIHLSTSNNANFKIYPNPASTYINIEMGSNITGTVKTEISDVAGKLVQRKTVTTSTGIFKLNIANLNPGIYLITISNNGKKHFQKIVVSR